MASNDIPEASDVAVTAPCDMPGGYKFNAKVEGRSLLDEVVGYIFVCSTTLNSL